ncbi:tryptophan--tRNA ligase [Haliangium sp.]|uniref:tryptophan--tRNA ligase n=1 Tax=Haliangium sp. TaxID=2663208 RepID=UPI003D1197DC
MKTLFSGIQPSGELHLGNYLGAIRNWVDLQETYFCYLCIVDYHAITQSYEPKLMKQRVLEMATDVLACGVDPDKAVLFVQSHVPEHTELCWVFNAVAGFGDLSRMTQFKDKSARQPENVNVGVFDYPVLQAADILLYKAVAVPVGADQSQHLELTRRIARAFNHRFGKLFPEPDTVLSQTPKLLGLDGKAKMSKSLDNTLALAATDKQIRRSLARAATDPARVTREDKGDPDNCNLYTLHRFFSDEERQAWVRQGCTTADIGCVDCKNALADNVIDHLGDYRRRREDLLAHPEKVHDALQRGAEKARATARKTMEQVHKKLGLWA